MIQQGIGGNEGGWGLIAEAINNIGILQGQKGDTGETGAKGDAAGVGLEIFNWTGSQNIASGAFFNLGSLALALDPTSNIGITRVGTAFKFPEKEQKTQVVFRVRLTGSVGGNSGTAREFFVQTRRLDATTLVGSKSSVKIDGNSISNRDIDLTSYTSGVLDRFFTEGINVGVDNASTQQITLTDANLVILQIG